MFIILMISSPQQTVSSSRTGLACFCPPGHRQCLGQCLVHRRDATSHFPMNEWERGKCSEAQETSQGYLPVLSSPTSFRNAQHATLTAPSILCLLLVMSGVWHFPWRLSLNSWVFTLRNLRFCYRALIHRDFFAKR